MQAQRFRVRDGLFVEDAAGQGLGRVVRGDREAALEEDRAVVVLVVDVVHRAAAELAAAFEDGAVYAAAVEALASESREQGGVDVEDVAYSALGDVELAQEARQQHGSALRSLDRLEGLCAEDLVGELASGVEHERG